jgi:hypothetical protein
MSHNQTVNRGLTAACTRPRTARLSSARLAPILRLVAAGDAGRSALTQRLSAIAARGKIVVDTRGKNYRIALLTQDRGRPSLKIKHRCPHLAMLNHQENLMKNSSRILVLMVVICALALFTGYTLSSAQQQNHSRLVLQASADESIFDQGLAPKRIAVSQKDGRKLYLLDARAGNVILHDGEHMSPKKIITPVIPGKAEAFAVSRQDMIYILDSDSIVHVLDTSGALLSQFPVRDATSLAVLGNGNVVVAAPYKDKLLHMYSSKGVWLSSFGEITTFEPKNRVQNDFYNKGEVVVGTSGEIYFVPWYAPAPYVQKFSSEGKLVRKFKVDGAAVELQIEHTTDFWRRNSRAGCVGGYRVINTAAVDPTTGHLWIGTNGLSTSGVVYEYNTEGQKLREYSFLLSSSSDSKLDVITGVRDLAIQGLTLQMISRGKVHTFSKNSVVAGTSAPQNNIEPKRRPLLSRLLVPFVNAFWSSSATPAVLQQASCPTAQPYDCDANCAEGSQTLTVDCDAEIGSQLGTDRVVTTSTCTRKATTGGSLGGCKLEVSTCNTSTGVTGTLTTEINCQPLPTPPPPENPETPPPDNGGGGGGIWSPVIIDTRGDGIELTDYVGGVLFDLNGDGTSERLSWTTANSDDAWLALDRNGNSTVDSGQELFGNFTPQPTSATPNGFLALAEYDKPENGGNSDGLIDSRDAIFSRLRLWQDENHNGVSEPTEIKALSELDVASINLDYKESKRVDEHGNQFRYRAKVRDVKGAKVGRWAWDVFLTSAP